MEEEPRSCFHLSEECREEVFWGAGGVSKIKGGFLEELPGENKEDIFQLVVGIWRWNRGLS